MSLEDSPGSSIWQRLGKIFHANNLDTVEKAIRNASNEGELDKEEGSMLLSVLNLDDLQAQDIMTPRTDIVCIEDCAELSELAEVIVSSGHSRIPVYNENRDNIIGVIHAKDILAHLVKEESSGLLAKDIMREPFFVPETKNVLELLQEIRTRKQHLAIILDEYGGTTGLVSIEDVIEEIVGDIEDEHDAPRAEEILPQEDGSYLVAGRAYLEDIAERLNLTIESDEVDTIGGYLSLVSGRVPKAGESFTIDSATFSVLMADAKQIHSLVVVLPHSGPASSPKKGQKNSQHEGMIDGASQA